jgi:POT family proton-dependent oligopeptide transporter
MTATADTLSATAGRGVSSRAFLGHPLGLWYIVVAEAWERFSFYGMQSLLVLYMEGYLFRHQDGAMVAGFHAYRTAIEAVFGTLSVPALAAQTFGLYVGLIYLAPLAGGWVGDRVTGRTRAVVIGGTLMAIGHFMMAFEAAFLIALACLILGSGMLKGNLAAQVSDLYAMNDPRRDAAFSMYCMSINVGVFVAPLVCGALGELYGWHYGFGAAGVGMLIGLIIYLGGRRHLPAERPRERGVTVKMTSADRRTIGGIAFLLGIVSLYWIGQTQAWNVYALWVRDRVDRDVLGFTLPASWFQSFDGLSVLVITPLLLMYWRRLAQRKAEPRDLTKVAIGCGIFGLAMLCLVAGGVIAGGAPVNILWPLMFHVLCSIAYMCVWPIALSIISRAAPASVQGLMIGAYYISIFIGGIFSGWLGRFYELLSAPVFWLLHAAIVASGTVITLVFRRKLASWLRLEPAGEIA